MDGQNYACPESLRGWSQPRAAGLALTGQRGRVGRASPLRVLACHGRPARRGLTRPTTVTEALWLATLLLLIPGHGLADKAPGDLTGSWQLFIDDYLVASKNNVARKYHPFEKHPANPVLVVDQPWEHNVVNCTTVLPNEDGKGFRMWYYCWTGKSDPDHSHALYATSADGIHWEKPKLGLIPWKATGSKENNFVGAGSSIMHTPQDPEPARRYKAVSPGKYFFSASADGLHWERLSKGEIFSAGDTGHVMWDPLTQKYRGYAKVNALVRGLRRRAVGYSEGTGFDEWPALRLVMAPDDFDDRWAKPGSVQRTHFYNCPVIAYQNMYLGLLMVYRAEDEEGYFHGPIFVELVTSRDGFHWLREEGERPPLLACGPERSFDHGMVSASSLLVVGDQLWLYYSGYDGLHDYLPFHSAVGLATMRKDGLASLDGGDIPGEVVTKPLKGLSGKLHLNCKAGEGLLQVEVLDAKGRVLPGYRRRDCNEPRGDGVDQLVTWQEHPELPAGKEALRLKFLLKNVSLYGFKAGDSVHVLDEAADPPLAALFTFEDDTGNRASNKLSQDGKHELRFLGTSKIDRQAKNAAFGEQSVSVASQWRPLNTLQITGSSNLGTHFTLGVMAKSADNQHARLFSSYNGNTPVNTSELVFDYDTSGKLLTALRLICKGIAVDSKPLNLADRKYHHLCVTYDDGQVQFYVDGDEAGEAWLPGGAPVKMDRDLLVGEDAELGSDEQFDGNLDDILVLGRALSAAEIKSLAAKGAEAFFGAEIPKKPKRQP